MNVAQTIIDQLGNKFIVMTGAKNFLDHDDALSFQLPGNFAKQKINRVKITLTPQDTYTLEFGKYTGGKSLSYKVIETRHDIYCDQLQDIFTSVTGLDTHL